MTTDDLDELERLHREDDGVSLEYQDALFGAAADLIAAARECERLRTANAELIAVCKDAILVFNCGRRTTFSHWTEAANMMEAVLAKWGGK